MTGYLPGMRAAAVLQSAVGYRVKVVDMRVSLKRLNQQVAAAPGKSSLASPAAVGPFYGIWELIPSKSLKTEGTTPESSTAQRTSCRMLRWEGFISTSPSAQTAPISGSSSERKRASARLGSWAC